MRLLYVFSVSCSWASRRTTRLCWASLLRDPAWTRRSKWPTMSQPSEAGQWRERDEPNDLQLPLKDSSFNVDTTKYIYKKIHIFKWISISKSLKVNIYINNTHVLQCKCSTGSKFSSKMCFSVKYLKSIWQLARRCASPWWFKIKLYWHFQNAGTDC